VATASVPPNADLAAGQRTVTEKVMARLRTMLITGGIAPGSRIDQLELARRFEVSIVPIREALARLASVGLVRIVPHRGVFVAEVSTEELVDLYTVRESLEEQAARIAVDRLTDEDFAKLDELAAAMARAAQERDLDEVSKHNRELHFTLYRAAKRRYMMQIIEQLWDLSARYAHLQLYAVPDRAATAIAEVTAIIAACRRRDREAVGLMVRYKVHQTTVGLLERMEARDPDPEAQKRSGAAKKPRDRKGRRGTRKVSR
jgi:DNA-binding GntR family transcriptional regulator